MDSSSRASFLFLVYLVHNIITALKMGQIYPITLILCSIMSTLILCVIIDFFLPDQIARLSPIFVFILVVLFHVINE